MPNFKSLQNLLGVPSSFEDEEPLYSKMPSKEEELEQYISTPKYNFDEYRQNITPEHREVLEKQRKDRDRTEEFEKPLEEDVGPISALGYYLTKGLLFDERPPSEFEKGGGGVYESTSPIDFVTPPGLAATGKGIASLLGKKPIPKGIVSEILPATKFQRIKQTLPSSTVEGKVITPQLAAEERLALPAPATEEPLGLPMPKQELPAPSTKSIEAMPMVESPVALEQAVEAETPAIVSSKPVARAKKSVASQEPEPDRFIIPGMFSKTEQLIRQKMGRSASPQQIMGILKEAKPEEIEYIGLPKFLEGKSRVTKPELIAHIQENLPKIEEKTLGGKHFDELENVKKVFGQAKDREYELASIGVGQRENVISIIGKSVDDKTLNDLLYYVNNQGPIYEEIKQKVLNSIESPQQKNALMKELSDLETTQKLIVQTRNQYFDAVDKMQKLRDISPEPKFKSYSIPGGESYQERLYTLPAGKIEKLQQNLDKINDSIRNIESNRFAMEDILANPEGSNAQALEYLKLRKEEIHQAVEAESQRRGAVTLKRPFTETPFRSGHFDEENILAHVRTKERIGPSGEKTLFAEEIQSDWHQTGRSHGYRGELPEGWTVEPNIEGTSKFKVRDEKGVMKGYGDSPSEALEMAQKNTDAVPSGPLKKSWHEFVSKRLLHDAAESGAGSLSWTTGATQAGRYNLAKHVDEILAQKQPDGTFHIVAQKNGQHVTEAANLTGDQLEAQLGKDLAKKIVQESGEKVGTSGTLKYSGNDLMVGGEGMKGFYDQIIPQYIAKLTKKYGVKPEKKLMPTKQVEPDGFFSLSQKSDNEWVVFFHENGDAPKKAVATAKTKEEGLAIGTQLEKEYLKNATKQQTEEIWNVKITPEMREEILKKGFPMFMLPGFMQQQEEVPEQKKEFNNINKLVKDKK